MAQGKPDRVCGRGGGQRPSLLWEPRGWGRGWVQAQHRPGQPSTAPPALLASPHAAQKGGGGGTGKASGKPLARRPIPPLRPHSSAASPELRAPSGALPARPLPRETAVDGAGQRGARPGTLSWLLGGRSGRTPGKLSPGRAASEWRAGQGASERAELRAPGASCPAASTARGRQGHPGGGTGHPSQSWPRRDPPCSFVAPSSQPSRPLLAVSLHPLCNVVTARFLASSLPFRCALLAPFLHAPCCFFALSIQSPATLTPSTLLAISCPFAAPRGQKEAAGSLPPTPHSPEGTTPTPVGTRSPSPPPSPEQQRPPVPPTYEQPGEPPAPDHGGRSVSSPNRRQERRDRRRCPRRSAGRGARRRSHGPPPELRCPRRRDPGFGPPAGGWGLRGQAPERSPCSAPKPCEGGRKGEKGGEYIYCKIKHRNPPRLRCGARPPRLLIALMELGSHRFKLPEEVETPPPAPHMRPRIAQAGEAEGCPAAPPPADRPTDRGRHPRLGDRHFPLRDRHFSLRDRHFSLGAQPWGPPWPWGAMAAAGHSAPQGHPRPAKAGVTPTRGGGAAPRSWRPLWGLGPTLLSEVLWGDGSSSCRHGLALPAAMGHGSLRPVSPPLSSASAAGAVERQQCVPQRASSP